MSDETKELGEQPRSLDGLAGCPFCGCRMGILELDGFQWFGNHKSCCPLEGNPSASWGRREDLVKDWNTRASNDTDEARSKTEG